MQLRSVSVFLAVAILAVSAHAAPCNFNVSVEGADHLAVRAGSPYTLTWSPIPGATEYRVVESPLSYATPAQAAVGSNLEVSGIRFPAAFNPLRFGARHYATDDRYFGYTITAYAPDGSEVCRTSLAVKIQPDDAIRSFLRRAIVAVAGSLTAADGSKFHTSLRLFLPGTSSTPATGRIIFHPQGSSISDNDPSISYRLETLPDYNQPGATQYWDDVVAAIGASGLGSLDIVPDAGDPPMVDARVWNDIRGVINGGTVQAYKAVDLLLPGMNGGKVFQVWTDGGKSRMNVGFRTYGPTPLTVTVITHGTTPHNITIPGNSFVQMPLSAVLAGLPAQDGQQVSLRFNYAPGDYSSAAFAYYTITENSSNDPRVFVKEPLLDVTTPVVY